VQGYDVNLWIVGVVVGHAADNSGAGRAVKRAGEGRPRRASSALTWRGLFWLRLGRGFYVRLPYKADSALLDHGNPFLKPLDTLHQFL
jgi:hypothetical protein